VIKWLGMLLRNPVARVTGFIIVPVLFALWWQAGGAPGAVSSYSEAQGVITEVYKHAYLITLDDGQQVRVLRTRKLASGTRVRLRVSHHESGLTQYMLPGGAPPPP
jgi:hypothetical protein